MSFGVAMISSVFYPSIGGAQRVVLDVSRGLRARGVDVFVVTRHYRGLARYELVDGVPTYRVGWGDRGKAVAALSYIIGALWLLLRLRRRFDVMHCHQMISPMTIGLIAKLLLRRALVVMPHRGGDIGDIAILTKRRRWSGKLRLLAARRWVDAFVCISATIHDELRGVDVSESKLYDIVNGVDVARIAPVDEAHRAALRQTLHLPAGRLIAFAGRLAVEKGLHILLDALPALRERVPDARVLLVGEGDQRAALEAQAKNLGISDSVTFAGSTDDVAPFLQAADAFVLPSSAEGLPVSLLEAMSCALPCVGTDVVGTRELLQDGRNGRLVPFGNASALAAALADALTSPEAPAWGVAARQLVIDHYSLDAVLMRYLDLYATISRWRSGSLHPIDSVQRNPS